MTEILNCFFLETPLGYESIQQISLELAPFMKPPPPFVPLPPTQQQPSTPHVSPTQPLKSTPHVPSNGPTPKQHIDFCHSLFWSVFIFHYGQTVYDLYIQRFANRELEERQLILEYLQKNSVLLKETNQKNVKSKRGLQVLLSALMIAPIQDQIQIVIAQCVYYKINVILCKDNTYLAFTTTGATQTCYLRRMRSTQYISIEKVALDTMVALNHFEKPLLACSHYTVYDLIQMCDKLGLSKGTGLKQDLYENLCIKIGEIWDF